MKDLIFFKKYGLEIKEYYNDNGTLSSIGYVGNPQYPNGDLLAIVTGHIPMKFRHYRRLTFIEEIEVIKNIIKHGRENERYPLFEESGQVAIYKKESYVYDTISNNGVFNDFESLNNSFDEKGEEPIMKLPSEDMLGILEDYHRWKMKQGNKKVS